MPVRATPAAATDKWVSNLSGATDRMTSGAMAVTVAPGQKAAAAKAKWLARVTQSADKFATNVGAVSLQSWQQSYTQIGIPRVAQGAQAKRNKYQAFAAEFFPYLKTGTDQVAQMPSTTLQDNVARAVFMINYNAKFRRGASGA